jgi:hypothetical protein
MSLDLYFTVDDLVLWSGNITHNLTRMANAVGAYGVLWRPEENDIQTASQLIEPLIEAAEKFLRTPIEKLRELEPENKWGTAENLIAFIEEALHAARKWPEAKVVACR